MSLRAVEGGSGIAHVGHEGTEDGHQLVGAAALADEPGLAVDVAVDLGAALDVAVGHRGRAGPGDLHVREGLVVVEEDRVDDGRGRGGAEPQTFRVVPRQRRVGERDLAGVHEDSASATVRDGVVAGDVAVQE
jgi:hypothetical protein